MRREIIGILLVFALVFTGASLLTYHPSDPSINVARASGPVHNLFGTVGSHLSGFLIYLFGVGSFWFPLIMLILVLHVWRQSSLRAAGLTVAGGALLVVATGGLLSLYQTRFTLFGQPFSSGGLTGIPLAKFLIGYTNKTGGFVLLMTAWIIGLLMATRLSLVDAWRWTVKAHGLVLEQAKTLWVLYRERRDKAKRTREAALKLSPAREVTVKVAERQPKKEKKLAPPKQETFEFMQSDDNGYCFPSLELLDSPSAEGKHVDHEALQMQSRLLEKKLSDFGVSGRVVAVSPGPVITMYEYEPAPGVKINRVVNLTDDLALALRAQSIRVVAPIPGKAVIGIEVPNAEREVVQLRELLQSDLFQKAKSKLTLALGKDIMGDPVVADLAKMPHLLIAGATGSGKSVALNAMICSILYKSSPDEVKLILVDPKRIELSAYEGIPHLIAPVVMDARQATQALMWAVREMERRYILMSEKQVRNIQQYQRAAAARKKEPQKVKEPDDSAPQEEADEGLPLILIIIDELADLMLVASRDVELAVTRLAQMARAAGIHLLLATQRPSVDVLTGIIKANFPTRISFQVSSRTDSRTILDANGAEQLLGNGDMLFLPPGRAKLQRLHGAYVSEAELRRIIDFLKEQKPPIYKEEVLKPLAEDDKPPSEDEYDERYDEAVAIVTETRQASISMIQRRLRVGYNRAARMIEMMEREGVVGPSDGVKPREVLVRGYDG